MPKYEMNYEWTCPRCGEYNSASYHCAKCFYDPKTPKQRLNVIAVALGAGCALFVIPGVWLVVSGVTGLGAALILVGGLMGWGAAKW
jgi:NMD protein affecting ribosome stability and mRNA decay